MGEHHQQRKRGPRGKYARHICQRCRSRKIKCVLPQPDNVRPLGSPLPEEKACERCRSLGLDCVIEATVLGRPSHRRGPPFGYSPSNSGGYLTTRTTGEGSVSTVGSEENVPSPAIEDVKGYFYTDVYQDGSGSDAEEGPSPNTRRRLANSKQLEDTFQTMVDSTRFVSSILARDEAFGATISPAMPRFSISLIDLISHNIAAALDKCLGWHRFFTPQAPTLVSIRKRLLSDQSTSSSSTNLLFALLCLIALEMPGNPIPKEHTRPLVKNMQLAVSTFGQTFIFSPSNHPDSLTVALLLANYKPTALINSQSIAHISINAEIYMNIAYRVAKVLNMLPAQAIGQLEQAAATDTTNLHLPNLENLLVQSAQAFQVYCVRAIQGHFFIKTLEEMKHILKPLRPQVELFRSLLKSHQCLPSVIYHVQNAIGQFIMMDAMTSIKQNWDNLDNLSTIIEATEKKAMEEIVGFNNNEFLAQWSGYYENDDQLHAIRALLELQAEWVPLDVCGFGIICAMASKARADSMAKKAAAANMPSNNESGVPEPSYGDIAKTGSRVIDSLRSIKLSPNGQQSHNDRFLVFVARFGKAYRERLYLVLKKMVSCVESLSLDGVKFQLPRHFVFKAVMLCKNIVENCLVNLHVQNRLTEEFRDGLTRVPIFVERLKEMIASSPWQSVDEGFAGGCIYAASHKVAHSLYEVMEGLRDRADRRTTNVVPSSDSSEVQQQPQQQDVSMAEPLLTDMDLIGIDDIHLEGWGSWSEFSGYDMFGSLLQEPLDWSSVYNLFPETEYTFDSEIMNPYC